jgi:3-oxoacyl-[acyl-carrier protein] reductase
VTGFIKSAAKEVGKKGATANAIFVKPGAENLLAGPLRFFLSNRSAFVDGQTLTVAPAGNEATPWTKPLAGKVALVTGAARGIGEITARRLADEGAKVIVLDVPQAQADVEKLAAQLGGVGLTLDITAADAVAKIRKTAEQAGGLNIVVNNAGITRDKTLANMNADQWNLALNVNLKAALAITEGALPTLGNDGRAIFLSSIAGIAGNFGQTNYGAAKSGLIGAIRHLAGRFADKGATVNGVAPGFIETQMTAAIPFVTREAGRRLSNLGQGGLPIDVAETITFLVSPGARAINGQVLRVCGGNYLGA